MAIYAILVPDHHRIPSSGATQMSLDILKPFSQRGSINKMPFTGLLQYKEPDCVFASIAGAVNHLMGSAIWKTAHDLYDACVQSGITGINFDAVISVALKPIAGKIRFDIPRERIKNAQPQFYLNELSNCVTNGGIAIVSLEAYETQQRTTGLGCWHMLTLIDKSQGWYQVWDTNNFSGSVSEQELITAISAYGISCYGKNYPHVWFHLHDKYDCILLWRI